MSFKMVNLNVNFYGLFMELVHYAAVYEFYLSTSKYHLFVRNEFVEYQTTNIEEKTMSVTLILVFEKSATLSGRFEQVCVSSPKLPIESKNRTRKTC